MTELAIESRIGSVQPMVGGRRPASLPSSEDVARETAPLRRLDSVAPEYLQDAACPFLKIDTQGYEAQVLQGAGAFLDRIRGVQIELSLVPLYEGQALYIEVIRQLQDRGFALFGVLPGFSDNVTGRMLQMDGLFFREPPAPLPAR